MKQLLLLPALLMLIAGCGESNPKPKFQKVDNRPTLTIDTIQIHGKSHEIIVRDKDYYKGGIMHSPECWCGKEESK